MANADAINREVRMAALAAAAKVNQPTGTYRPPEQISKATIEIAKEFETYIWRGYQGVL